jgi:4-hydroxybenzoate polyprenyltransferase
LSRLLHAARVIHPFPSALVAATALVLVAIADANSPFSRYVAIGLGMLFYQAAIGATNDLVDFESDRLAKPWKPLVAGALSARTATGIAGVSCVAGLGITAMLSWQAWLIGVACLACGLAYDLRLKRSAISWAPYAIAFSLLPVWVFVAAEAWSAFLWWVFPIGMTLGFALHLANQGPDVESAHGDFLGLPTIIGERMSDAVAIAGFAAAAGAAAIVLGLTGAVVQMWIAIAVGCPVLAVGPLAARAAWETALFALLAVSAAVLAIVFLSAA